MDISLCWNCFFVIIKRNYLKEIYFVSNVPILLFIIVSNICIIIHKTQHVSYLKSSGRQV